MRERGRGPLVIFDCDGVLVDSEPLANRVFTDALREAGLELDYEQVCATFIGLSMKRCGEIIAEMLGRPLPAAFFDELEQRTFAAFRDSLQPVRGVAAALERIALPVCVASSGEHHKMRLTLGLTGLAGHFAGRLFSATEVQRGKPSPDLYLHAAAQCGFDPAECVVVEDSEPGVRGARAAGMRVLGYAERSDPLRLQQAGALVFDSMDQLPGLLAGPAVRSD